MGLVQKKDEKDYIDGIEVIGRGDGPDPDVTPEIDCEIVPGQTAEDISGTTAARNEGMETEADPELLGNMAEDVAEEVAVDGEAEGDAEVAAGDEADADAAADAGVAEGASVAEGEQDAAASLEEPDANAHDDDSAAVDADDADESATEGDEPETPPTFEGGNAFAGKRHAAIFAGIALIAVIAAAIIGHAIGSDSLGAPKGTGAASISEDKLDAVVASWTFDGTTHDVTAREAIESQYSLSAANKGDDTYDVPPAETVLSYVRNQVLVAEARKQGMEVSDDELATYAIEVMGTDDFEAIAEQFSVSEDQAKTILREQSLIQKLYKEKATSAPEMPEQPTAPADEAAASKPTKEYADYIIELAGDEWDAEAGTWASQDGVVATALAGQEFSADAATYEQAQKAFAAVYQSSYQQVQKAQQEWTDYVNTLFASAQVKLYGIFA